MGITEFLAGYIVAFIDRTGYASVFVLMVMESMVLPVPSEAVMPFAGFLIAEGKFSFAGVIAYSTLGSIAGSLISYWLGLYGGKPVIERWGKYLLLDHRDLELTERFFKRRGDLAIFVSRFIPVIRHLISIPAGIGRMNIFTFSIYTVVGAGLWNTFLALAGYYLRQHWEVIMQYSRIVDIVVLVAMVGAITWFIYKHLRSANSSAGSGNGGK
jgi:membrane protein DedA with SNARE-associated domain